MILELSHLVFRSFVLWTYLVMTKKLTLPQMMAFHGNISPKNFWYDMVQIDIKLDDNS